MNITYNIVINAADAAEAQEIAKVLQENATATCDPTIPDAEGVVWDARIHKDPPRKTQRKKTWALKTRVDQALVEQVLAEQRHQTVEAVEVTTEEPVVSPMTVQPTDTPATFSAPADIQSMPVVNGVPVPPGTTAFATNDAPIAEFNAVQPALEVPVQPAPVAPVQIPAAAPPPNAQAVAYANVVQLINTEVGTDPTKVGALQRALTVAGYPDINALAVQNETSLGFFGTLLRTCLNEVSGQ